MVTSVIEIYGGRCASCGVDDREVLTLDHVNNDGAAHRRELGGDSSILLARWCVRNDYPPSIQVLCANCQLRKARRLMAPTD